MNTPILFSVWLNTECAMFVGAYSYNDKMYYTDTQTDLDGLFECFLNSELYKNSIGTKTLLNDAKLLSEAIDSLFYADYHKASKSV